MRSYPWLNLSLSALLSLSGSAVAQSSVTTVVPPKGKQTQRRNAPAVVTRPSAPPPLPRPTMSAPAAMRNVPATASRTVVAPSPTRVVEQPAAAEMPAPVRRISAPVAPPPPPEPEYAGLEQNVLTDLPDGMQPNTPNAKLMAKSHRKWKGEYEAGYDGKPLLDPVGRPVPVLYTRGGKRIKSKVKLPKGHPIRIVSAVMTIDGWPGKARLNYDIPDLKFLYLSGPNIGTVVVSTEPFPGGTEQTEAFKDKVLTVTVEGHEFQLASDKTILGNKKVEPASAWVKFDPDFTEDPKYPVMGYGFADDAPYVWPGAKLRKAEGVLKAPPIPKSLQPKMEAMVCVKNCAPEPVTAVTTTESFATTGTPAADPARVAYTTPMAVVPPPPQANTMPAVSRQAPPPLAGSSSASGLGSSTVKMVVKPRGAKK